MPRNKKCRRICLNVECRMFQAVGGEENTLLGLDELEAMRGDAPCGL